MGDSTCETTAVIICGGGPTGALLSALLGQLRVPNVVLEREKDITTDPRGIALDDDGMRMMQGIGMYERLFTQIALCQNINFIGGAEKDLHKKPFLTFDVTSGAGGTGHVGVLFHKQPELERAIRDSIAQSKSSELRSGCQLVSIAEDDSIVKAEYLDSQGERRQIKASFLIGADGKTGFVRKHYLEPKGVTMERAEGTNYDETWVALNWQIRLPTPESHPEFPLWKLGYMPEQVYDLFFPKDFRFLCNHLRPSVCGRFGLPADRLWRFEFVIQEGEDPVQMATREETSKIIYPYITHDGKRYGLNSPVRYPEDCITTLRSRPFHFSARSCNRWADGRVCLVGDAAHVFPPFGGQGIASGFRDASSLAWRLAHLHRELRADHGKLLQAWYSERKEQLERSLALTVRNGEFCTNPSPWKAFVRDWVLWGLQSVPFIKQELQKGPRAGGMTRYKSGPGRPFVASLGGGMNLPQVYARDLKSGEMCFSDDMIFKPDKEGLFQLLILSKTTDEAWKALWDIQELTKRTSGRLREDEATILIHDLNLEVKDAQALGKANVARIASREEFATHPVLCHNRPEPQYYNPLKIWDEVGRNIVFVVLRPDRFVYASCSNIQQLWQAMEQLDELLCLPSLDG